MELTKKVISVFLILVFCVSLASATCPNAGSTTCTNNSTCKTCSQATCGTCKCTVDFKATEVGKTVTFKNLAVCSCPIQARWTFGDGTISSALNPKHTYAKAGSYVVHLYVYNNCMKLIGYTGYRITV